MTSKISFSNLRRENTKHRIGMISVVLLGFLGYIIMFIMSVQNAYYVDGSLKHEEILAQITALSQPDVTTGILAIIAGVLLAASAFRYLHVKTEVDLYHALPIKRKDHFFVILTNDSCLFLFLLTAAMIIRCIVVVCVGCLTKAFFMNTLSSVICYFVLFMASYLLMLLTMLLTGNTFTAFLGCGVLAIYFPIIVRNLYPTLAQAFFKTYWTDSQWGRGFFYLSPVSAGFELLKDYEIWTWKRHIIYFVVLCVWIILLLVIDYVLFLKRPSEMAGKAMAFPKTKPFIRILIVVPMAIYTGMMLYTLSISIRKEWIIIGIVIGTALFHGIIECIYRFDVRGLWAYKKQMLLSMGAALLIVGFFWMDIFGYDSYLPEKTQLSSVLIDIPGTGSSFWGKERKGISGDDLDSVLDVLDQAVKKNDENYERSNSDSVGQYNTYGIVYRLKNGQEKKRYYVMDPKLQDEWMCSVFDNDQYRRDTFSLYTADWSMVTRVSLSYPVQDTELDITKKQRTELFRIYLEEFSKLDYQSVKELFPCGELMIEHQGKDNIYAGYAESIDCYNIYPTFKKTISYLKDELNIELNTSMKELDVAKLSITEYNEETDKDETYTITDQKVIESVKDKLCYGDGYWNSSVLRPEDPISYCVWANVNINGVMQEVSLYTTLETYEQLKEAGEKE